MLPYVRRRKIVFRGGKYVPMSAEEAAICDELEMVAGRYRVWGLMEDRRRLAQLQDERAAWLGAADDARSAVTGAVMYTSCECCG